MLALEEKIPPAGDRTRDFPITKSTFYHWAISPAVNRENYKWKPDSLSMSHVSLYRKKESWIYGEREKWSTINQEGKNIVLLLLLLLLLFCFFLSFFFSFFLFSFFLLFVVVENPLRQICGSEGPWNVFCRIVDKNSKRFFKQGVRLKRKRPQRQ